MQDARMLLPGGARGRVLFRAGHQRLERLEERLDAHPRALPGLQERWRQGSRGQRHPGALRVGRSHERDLERIRKAREEAIRRNNVLTGNTEGGEIPTVVGIVEATGEPVEETEPEAEAATPKPKKTKNAPEWKSLPDAEKAQYLLDHQTISDRTWTEESRLKGEKRDAFIHRILGFPKTP
jgi:hypothetical protein